MTNEPPELSIVIPAYNEAATIEQVIDRVQSAPISLSMEILIVDDSSKDGTDVLIRKLAEQENIRAFYHAQNQGKGAALRTAFQHAQGQIVLIQDADLEYSPEDYPQLLEPILSGQADVVYGSRFRGGPQRIHLFWHRLANGLLTFLSNLMNNLNLSDMETGYKVFRREVLSSFEILENRFGVEPEITAKIARRDYRIYEVPISYAGRDYAEGKKIGVRDAFRALWCIVRYRLAD